MVSALYPTRCESVTGFFQQVRVAHQDKLGAPRHHRPHPVLKSPSGRDVDRIGNVTLCIGLGVSEVNQVVLFRVWSVHRVALISLGIAAFQSTSAGPSRFIFALC